MAEDPPVIIVEQAVVEAASQIATGYDVRPIPANGNSDLSDFSGRKLILWPDAAPASREAFRRFAEKVSESCLEIKLIVPNGKAHGWNIATAVADGMSWRDLAMWAKESMMVFGKGEFPRVIVETVEAADEIPDSAAALWENLGLAMSQNNTPVPNIDNVVRILTVWKKFQFIIWFDEFYKRYFTNLGLRPGEKAREWSDIDDINMTVRLQREFSFFRISQETVAQAIRHRAHQCIRNDPREWMERLKWDGRPRIDRFFIHYIGAHDSGYSCGVGRNFWIGMVARIFRPGCQLDNMVILEGQQGIYKSKALEAIGGKWYMEASEEITSKDFFVALAGKIIVEIADLDSFSRADANRIKKVITCRTDRYRMPYARTTQDHPRQSIFVGTTNESHYLRDNTGGRRFWPITCFHIDLEGILRDREQLFAEAVTRYLAGEDWYKMPAEATLSEQEDRRQYDEWENIVSTYLRECCKTQVFLHEVAAQVGVDKAKLDFAVQRRLGNILRRMGWQSAVVRIDDVMQRVWKISNPQLQAIATDSLGQPLSDAPVLPLTD